MSKAATPAAKPAPAPAAAAAKPAAASPAKPAAPFGGEVMKASEVNDENIAKHIANKKDVNKEVASGHAPNVEKYGPKQTLLWWASYGGHKGAVAALLKAGAKKDFKAKDGSTALLIAEHKEHDEIVVLLGGKPKPKVEPKKEEAHEHHEKAHPHRDLEKEKKMHEEAMKKKAAEDAKKPAPAAAAKPAAAPAGKKA